MARKPKMINILVTDNEQTHHLFPEGRGGQGISHLFLQAFSDVLLDKVAPANVKFQRYADNFEEYVDVNNNERLDEDEIKLLALVSKREKQFRSFQMPNTKMLNFHGQHDGAKRLISFQKGGYPWPTAYNRNFMRETSRASGGEATPNHPHSHPHPHPGPHVHWGFPWIHVHHEGAIVFPPTYLFSALPISTFFFRPHTVEQDTNYRMWSPVCRQSDGLVQRDPTNNNVNCEGAFGDTTGRTVISTSDINQNYVSLLFKDLTTMKQYVMMAQTGKSGNINIEAVETSPDSPYPDKATFAPDYYWSYTIFRNKFYNQKYLGCDGNGNMTLVDMASLDYPNPQALFILNKVPNPLTK